MYIKLFFIGMSFSLLFFSGCGSQKRAVVAQKKEIPAWYQHPPKSSMSELYAVGSGRDKQAAITDALTQMVSTLSVSVSSKFSAKTVVKEAQGNYLEAKEYYENADNLMIEPVEEINAAVIRINSLIDKHQRTQAQLAR